MPLLTFPWPQILSADGSTYPGAKLFFYETGTSTLATTYTDAALTTPHTNPVIADATGVFPPIYLANKRYKAILRTAGDVTLFTADPVTGGGDNTVATIADMTAIDSPTNGTTVQVSDLNRGGYFVFDTASTSAADNGITFKADDATSGSWVRQYSGPVDVRWFGALLDGTTNDSAALSAASAFRDIYIPPSAFGMRLATPVVFSSPVRLIGKSSLVKPDIGTAGGKVLAFETDDVVVSGLVFDGGSTGTATGNSYVIFGGDGTTLRKRHVYTNLEIKNATTSDGNTGDTNLLVTHAIYVDNAAQVEISDCSVDNVSGAAVFLRDIDGLVIRGNTFRNTVWYTVTLEGGVSGFLIENNRFISATTNGVYWGGAINLMSQVGETRNARGVIRGNKISGAYSYGGVMRILSTEDLLIEDNWLFDLTVGAVRSTTDLSGIRIETRGISTASQNGPCKRITIRNNTLHGPSGVATNRNAIYISNSWQTTRVPVEDVRVEGNRILSPDTTNYWQLGISVHGLDGGAERVHVLNNLVQTYIQASSTVGGAIGFVGNDADGSVDRVWIGGNDLTDIGSEDQSYQYGIGINSYVDEVYNVAPNRINNFAYGLRTLANSGPSLYDLDAQHFVSNGLGNALYAVNLARYGALLTGSATWDAASIATGGSQTTTVTVTGAALGDFADASFSLDIQDMSINAYVVAANTVEVVLQNNSGGSRDLASGTVYVRVRKRGTEV